MLFIDTFTVMIGNFHLFQAKESSLPDNVSHLKTSVFNCVASYNADYFVRNFSCYDQFLHMSQSFLTTRKAPGY